ncbi:MAG TPA: amino acid adenylation domain-containing protein, partial [Blastocatellia bacterium]|nr:amino acid adenylation domain-containing protein [Blastocatellia bacterium]
AMAIEHDLACITYGELNRRANQLAHYLRRQGVGPDSIVGICLERSVDMLVSMLGVLKAGAAYAALDPAYPAERIVYMVNDSQALVVITGRASAGLLAEQRAPQVCLDAQWEAIAQESPANPARTATADNLAYVIYTSGSTGKPKGVMVQHSSLVSYTETATAQYDITAEDRVLQFASINFDTSVEEIYPCLTQGATLVLRDDAMLDTAATFLEQCREKELSVLDLPTTYWHELVEEIASEGLVVPAAIRMVIIGGEKAVAERLSEWHRHVGTAVRLVNSYGPTETTVVATLWESDAASETPAEVPIGRAIDNAEVYVLAQNLQPVPTGVHGECHIGGAGAARGYLRRPDLTAEKFIPNPFSDEPGARLYRSGDLVRYRGDGNLEYVGRTDHQVKVRGYRIELGEIEAALLRHTGIREAVVDVVENAPADKRLTAYLVLNEETAFSVSELRNQLKRQMPDYMLPTGFVKLNGLPRTANGKIDRRALKSLDGAKLETGEAYVAPRTIVEELLAGIWADLLETEEISVEENFFDLGGHSLLATQVVSRIRQAFQVEVPLRRLFESPTVAGLAAIIAQARATGEAGAVEAILPLASRQGVRLSSAQERLWLLNELQPGSAAYNIPAVWRLRGRLEVASLEQSLGEIVRRHEVLRTQVGMADEQPVQVITAAAEL